MEYKKALTFSYDDGVEQDKRLLEILNKYGLKATFNINSGLLGIKTQLFREGVWVNHAKFQPQDLQRIYEGHEIAAHSLTHPVLIECSKAEIIRQVEEDRVMLSKLAGYEVVGMAYPCGIVNDELVKTVKENTGIKYARTIVSTYNFNPQEDLHQFNPSVYHIMELNKMFELGEKFLDLKSESPQIFYIWGHSYEFDINNTWADFEEFCKMMSNREDIFYGTNREILLEDWAKKW